MVEQSADENSGGAKQKWPTKTTTIVLFLCKRVYMWSFIIVVWKGREATTMTASSNIFSWHFLSLSISSFSVQDPAVKDDQQGPVVLRCQILILAGIKSASNRSMLWWGQTASMYLIVILHCSFYFWSTFSLLGVCYSNRLFLFHSLGLSWSSGVNQSESSQVENLLGEGGGRSNPILAMAKEMCVCMCLTKQFVAKSRIDAVGLHRIHFWRL